MMTKKRKRSTHKTKKSYNGDSRKKDHPVLHRKPTLDNDIATEFAVAVHQKFDRLIKASILFGSQAKNKSKSSSDIDIILVIDDASINWDLELISWYREELSKIISRRKYNKELHINTIRLTTWWQDLLRGDPVLINILRYGQPLIDSGGFFLPIKALLLQGKIKSTPEAVHAALQRAPEHLLRSKLSEMGAIEGVYWTMIDSAQAALIMAGRTPPSPEHIPDLLHESFVSKGLLKSSYVKYMKSIYLLHKEISHRKINDIKGEEIDKWQEIAENFLSEMTTIIKKMAEGRKN